MTEILVDVEKKIERKKKKKTAMKWKKMVKQIVKVCTYILHIYVLYISIHIYIYIIIMKRIYIELYNIYTYMKTHMYINTYT